MSTRKIKDAKDLSTNELIYFKGHAQATYMSDGRTVEEAVNNIAFGEGVAPSSYVTAIKIDGVNRTPGDTSITEPTTIDLGFIHKRLDTMNGSSMALFPNIYYRNTSTSLSSLTIILGKVDNRNIINEYFVEFTTSSSGTTVSFPSTVKWANGETPTFEAGCTYQVSIVNNLGTVQKFK